MGKHTVYVGGQKIPHNDFMDYREYDTIAEMNAASAGWGANEVGRISLVLAAGAYYYWNGAVNVVWPSTGGAGAPTTSSYITLNAENPPLVSSVRHKDLTDGADPAGTVLHIPREHHALHEDGGAQEISVAGLLGLLADNQSAGYINHTPIDNTTMADNRILKCTYAWGVPFKIEWIAVPGGGDMTKAVYDTDADNVVESADNADTVDGSHAAAFALVTHKDTHKTGGGANAFVVTDLLDGIARVTVRKNTGANVGSRRRINFIEGTGISFTITDVAGSEELTVRVDATGAGLGGTWSTGICSGRSPIVTPHSLGGTPTLVLASINAAQPYPSPCWTADATNITFRHAVTAGCTITFAARL